MDDDGKTRIAQTADDAHYIALPSGFVLGKYELQAVLGQGGFGITYRAWDRELDRAVAVKEYLPSDMAVRVDGTTVKPRSRVEDESFAWGLTRFLDEARALARFDDAPAIVRVFDYMQANGTAYMVMALVDGTPLSGVYRREAPLDEARLKSIVLPLLQGLERVHEAGFLHRDIKPANILIRRDGLPVLIDFGAARQAIGEKSRSVTSVFTPGYAPFEQYMSNGKQGPWTDIYALAATLYHGITGKPPPQATDRIRDDDMEPAMRVGAARYSPEFLAAIDAGLATHETARPQTVAQWRAMLIGAGDAITAPIPTTLPISAPPTGPVSVGGPPSQPSQMPSQTFAAPKRSRLWLVLAAVLVVAVAGGGYAAWNSLQSDRNSIEAKLKAEEDARKKAEDDATKQTIAAAELRVRDEERQKASDLAAQQKAAEDAKRQADDEARKKAEADKAKADADAKKKADEAAKLAAAKPPAATPAAGPANGPAANPQIASNPNFAYTGRWRWTINCPNTRNTPFFDFQGSEPIDSAAVNWKWNSNKSDGTLGGAIDGNKLTLNGGWVSHNNGENYKGTFSLVAANNAQFAGSGSVSGFSSGATTRSCTIAVIKVQ